MLVFSEGVPRSGKSYDAVKNHILPALKRGRRVFARLNGLNHERIAAYLKMPLERVQQLLQHVPTNEVRETFVARQFSRFEDGGSGDFAEGQWVIDDKFKNALIVIDEVHEFYVGGTRETLPPEIEQFFALHGHYGMDVLVMTQFYKRVHTALRYRIERKNVFQKLSALGKKGEAMYRETAYQTVAPDKYEKVAASTKTYDADIFALYHGIVGGDAGNVQQAVYEGGRVTIWKTLGWRAVIILPLGIGAVWYLLDFFSGGGTALVKTPATVSAPRQLGPDQGEPIPGYVAPAAPRPAPVPAKPEMTPEQVFVWEMSDRQRIRLAATIGDENDARGLLEWLDSGGVVKDRLTFDQVRALGVEVTLHVYGARLRVGDEVVIATRWPLNVPLREERPVLYDTSGGRLPVSASEPLAAAAGGPAAASLGDSGAVAPYGGFR